MFSQEKGARNNVLLQCTVEKSEIVCAWPPLSEQSPF